MSVSGICPSCGAALKFGGADSLATVCSYCRSAVARAGAELMLIGKVPDLVATNSRLALGAAGTLGGKAFVVLGHLQLGHRNAEGKADALWDEWYAGFADGSWGWLAEAQGHFLYTQLMAGDGRSIDRNFPRYESLHAGKSVPDLPGAGHLTVDEVNTAVFASAEGELPFRPQLGAVYRFADCSTAEGAFVTLDYGAEDEAPQVFAGRDCSYAEAGLENFQPPTGRAPEGRALTCPNCGGALALKLSTSESAACPSCHSLLDLSKGGPQVVATVKRSSSPPLPLGARGRIEGNDYEVIGYLKRSVRVDNLDYYWREYLLHGDVGYRWLSESDGHWLFLAPVPAGKVALEGKTAVCDGRRFRHFQSAQAHYQDVQGEFYWRLEVGTPVETADYVAPPYLLSREETPGEVNWSRGQYLTGPQVWAAFRQEGRPPAAEGIGPAEPNPNADGLGRSWITFLYALLAITAVAVVLSVRSPRREELRLEVPVGPGEVTLSDPFELKDGPQAVEVLAAADVDQAWIGMDVALIDDTSGESDAVGLELSRYHGYDDGEWSEGSPSGSSIIGKVPDGRYLLRVESEVERNPAGRVPSSARVSVQTGVFLATPLLLALLLIAMIPLWRSFHAAGFEKERWEQSDAAGNDS